VIVHILEDIIIPLKVQRSFHTKHIIGTLTLLVLQYCLGAAHGPLPAKELEKPGSAFIHFFLLSKAVFFYTGDTLKDKTRSRALF